MFFANKRSYQAVGGVDKLLFYILPSNYNLGGYYKPRKQSDISKRNDGRPVSAILFETKATVSVESLNKWL